MKVDYQLKLEIENKYSTTVYGLWYTYYIVMRPSHKLHYTFCPSVCSKVSLEQLPKLFKANVGLHQTK